MAEASLSSTLFKADFSGKAGNEIFPQRRRLSPAASMRAYVI
jgi:hypothetical protein